MKKGELVQAMYVDHARGPVHVKSLDLNLEKLSTMT